MNKRKPNNDGDYENRFFQLLLDKIDGLEGKVDSNTKLTQQTHEQAKKTNSRVDKLDAEVFGKIKPQDLPPIWRDPKVISIAFNISLAVLVLIIAATKVNVTELLP